MGRIREDTVLSCPFMGNPLTCRKQTNSTPVSFRCFCPWCLSALSPRCLLNFHTSNAALVPALIRVMYEVTESRTGILQCDTAISKKVVGNSAGDNPNGVVGGFEFTVLQSSLKE